MPDGISSGVNDYLLTPVTNAITGLISAVSGPLIWEASVPWAIAQEVQQEIDAATNEEAADVLRDKVTASA